MSSVINTNVQSLNAQRNLTKSAASLSTSLQRLSSGLRINSAKDDAAGLAISERFTTQIRGLNVAVRNANDGISLSQTAEGALGEISSNLQRVRELAVQARNATNSASDRAALNAEVQQRLAEIERTASQTSFNGQKILDGTFGKATFQVGSNAGETIGLSLESSIRTSVIGKIASVTSNAIGADATGGAVTTAPITGFDFSAAGTADGGVTLNAASYLFDNVPDAGTGGTLSIAGGVNGDVDFTTAAAVEGIAVLDTDTFDYSGTGNLAQFDVTTSTGTIGITLTGDYTDVTGVAAEINTQLGALGGTATAAVVNDQIVITNDNGADAAVTVTNFDANATTAGFAASYTSLAGDAVDDATTFEVDGIAVNLDQVYADDDAVASAIQTQLNATGNYTVTATAGGYDIQNNVIGSDAPVIEATNASAFNKGFVTEANLTSTAGTPAVSANSVEFVVDGTTITLDDTTAAAFDGFDDIATYVGTQLGAGYTVSSDGSAISIVNNDGVTAVAVTASADTDLATRAAAAGFGPTAGAFTGAASLTVDGQQIVLNDGSAVSGAIAVDTTGLASLADLASALDTALDAEGYDVTTADSDGDSVADALTFTNRTLGSEAVEISGVDSNATAAGFADATGTAGVGEGTLTLASGDFSITDGTGKTTSFSGDYAGVQELADEVNAQTNGVFAYVTSATDPEGAGKLILSSSQEFTVGGAQAATFGFSASAEAIDDGALADINVLTTRDADETIVRIDSALQSVSSLRSDFGAIQNRFESTIANLQGTAENLAASRSRILDANFAEESANLVRAQILQQAGVSILAQANQLPQNVLSLLR